MLTKLQLKTKKVVVGVGIDDQAAIIVEGDKFHVVSTDGLAKVTKVTVNANGSILEKIYPSSNKKTIHSLSELIE